MDLPHAIFWVEIFSKGAFVFSIHILILKWSWNITFGPMKIEERSRLNKDKLIQECIFRNNFKTLCTSKKYIMVTKYFFFKNTIPHYVFHCLFYFEKNKMVVPSLLTYMLKYQVWAKALGIKTPQGRCFLYRKSHFSLLAFLNVKSYVHSVNSFMFSTYLLHLIIS